MPLTLRTYCTAADVDLVVGRRADRSCRGVRMFRHMPSSLCSRSRRAVRVPRRESARRDRSSFARGAARGAPRERSASLRRSADDFPVFDIGGDDHGLGQLDDIYADIYSSSRRRPQPARDHDPHAARLPGRAGAPGELRVRRGRRLHQPRHLRRRASRWRRRPRFRRTTPPPRAAPTAITPPTGGWCSTARTES